MQHALADAAVQLGLRRGQRRACRLFVAARDCRFDIFDMSADARDPRLVHGGATYPLARTLLCRLDIRHGLPGSFDGAFWKALSIAMGEQAVNPAVSAESADDRAHFSDA
jgi:hypothetical protein